MAPVYLGLDVAKATVELASEPAGLAGQFATDPSGLSALVAQCQAQPVALIVLEATGGYEAPIAAALATVGLPVAVVNPRQVRDFARALGRLGVLRSRRHGAASRDARRLERRARSSVAVARVSVGAGGGGPSPHALPIARRWPQKRTRSPCGPSCNRDCRAAAAFSAVSLRSRAPSP